MSITQRFTELVRKRRQAEADLRAAAIRGDDPQALSRWAEYYREDLDSVKRHAEFMLETGIDSRTIERLERDA